MAFDLQSWLLRFLQIYQLDRESLEDILIRAEDAETKPGVSAWDGSTAEAIRARTLIESGGLEKEVKRLTALFPPIPETPPETFESFRRHYEAMCQFNPRFFGVLAEVFGLGANITPEELIRNEGFQKFLVSLFQQQIAEERENRKQSSPTPDRLAIHFAQEFALKLSDLVSRAQKLEDLDYGDIVSDNLRLQLQEAHRCYLYGLDVSVAILCGSILEQALKERLGLDWKLELMLREAEDQGILTPEEWGMGDTVREVRNYAVHDLEKFMQPNIKKSALLADTRKVVRRLLASDSPRIENES